MCVPCALFFSPPPASASDRSGSCACHLRLMSPLLFFASVHGCEPTRASEAFLSSTVQYKHFPISQSTPTFCPVRMRNSDGPVRQPSIMCFAFVLVSLFSISPTTRLNRPVSIAFTLHLFPLVLCCAFNAANQLARLRLSFRSHPLYQRFPISQSSSSNFLHSIRTKLN